MDAIGARHLAARIRAGVRVGGTIVIASDDTESGLVAGDRGVVHAITEDGVVVEWDRGVTLTIDPQVTPYTVIEAA